LVAANAQICIIESRKCSAIDKFGVGNQCIQMTTLDLRHPEENIRANSWSTFLKAVVTRDWECLFPDVKDLWSIFFVNDKRIDGRLEG
jgi:hypothetical protein